MLLNQVDKQVRQLDNSLNISETRKKRMDDNLLVICLFIIIELDHSQEQIHKFNIDYIK